MNKKRLLSIALMLVMFLSVSFVGIDASMLTGAKSKTTIVAMAATRSKTGGFKSGSFKSSGGFSFGGFKSGGFFNTKKNNWSNWSSNRSWFSGSRSRLNFIPIPWGFRLGGFYPFHFMFGSIGAIIRLIIIIAVICYLVKRFRRRY